MYPLQTQYDNIQASFNDAADIPAFGFGAVLAIMTPMTRTSCVHIVEKKIRTTRLDFSTSVLQTFLRVHKLKLAQKMQQVEATQLFLIRTSPSPSLIDAICLEFTHRLFWDNNTVSV